jgi:hypothetical protein
MSKINECIEQAGWYENRRIDISYMIQDYIRHGFKEPNKLIQAFLMEYGNIKIEFRTDEGNWYDIRINPDVGFNFLESDDLVILEQIVDDHLLPIGSINSDHGGFLISFGGKFYLLGDEGIYHLGDNFLEVCETVFLQKPILKVGGPV